LRIWAVSAGKTGAALMDGRDGEALIAAHGPKADNGVRLPNDNLVANNIFANCECQPTPRCLFLPFLSV